jgi:pSer/pThr/pTyr-binding forkhead associated (FHA) protein
MPYLVCGEEAFALRADVTHVGRGITADVRLDDHTVSARHAILVVRTEKLRLLDDRSTNGTFVNGRRVDEAELHDGDVVVLGRVVLTYRDLR